MNRIENGKYTLISISDWLATSKSSTGHAVIQRMKDKLVFG